jgi:hypothetical protein
MAEVFSLVVQYVKWFITLLVWIAIVIEFFSSKGKQKIYFLVVLSGYLLISYFIQDFFLSTTFLTIWFVFTGVKYFVSKEILFVLFVALLFLDYSNPFFYIIAFCLYIITLSNFIFSTFSKLLADRSSS